MTARGQQWRSRCTGKEVEATSKERKWMIWESIDSGVGSFVARSSRFDSVEKTLLVDEPLNFWCVVVVVGYTWAGEMNSSMIDMGWVGLRVEGQPQSKTPIDIVNYKGLVQKATYVGQVRLRITKSEKLWCRHYRDYNVNYYHNFSTEELRKTHTTAY